MLDFLFIILFITFPILLYVFMMHTDFKVMHISLVSFVITSIFFFAYVGVLPLYLGWNEYYYSIGVQDKSIIINMFAFNSWSIFALLLGAVFTNNLFLTKKPAVDIDLYKPLNKKEILLLFLLFLICLAVLILYIKAVPKVALVVAIFEGFQEAKLSRSLMGNDFAGTYHRYNFFMRHVMDLVTFSFFAHWLLRKSKASCLMFVIAFLTSTVSAVIATEKAPFVWLLVGLFLVYTLVRHAGVYPLKGLLKFISIVIGVLIVFYIYFMGSKSIGVAFSSLVGRAFAGGIVPGYFYLDFFPKHHDFLWGLSFPNPGGILFHEPYRLTVEVMNWINPALAESDVVGSAPTVFWGEMYANFGVLGIILSPFMVGSGLCVIDSLLAKLESTPIKTGLMVWLLLHYKNLAETGLSGFIMDFYLLIILGIVFIIITMANNGRIVFKKLSRRVVNS